MENETQTTETVNKELETVTEQTSAPVETGEGEAESSVSVAVDGVEVSVTDSKGELDVTPVTGLVGVLVLGLLAVAVVKLRGKK